MGGSPKVPAVQAQPYTPTLAQGRVGEQGGAGVQRRRRQSALALARILELRQPVGSAKRTALGGGMS